MPHTAGAQHQIGLVFPKVVWLGMEKFIRVLSQLLLWVSMALAR